MSRLPPGLDEKLLGFGGVRARAEIEFAVLSSAVKLIHLESGTLRDLGLEIYYQGAANVQGQIRADVAALLA